MMPAGKVKSESGMVFLPVFLACFLVGCGSPTLKVVRVNLGAVAASLNASRIAAQNGAAPPVYAHQITIQGKSYFVPGATSVLGESGSADASAHVKQVLATAKRQTYEALLEQFKSIYSKEANAIRARRLLEFDPIRSKIFAEAMAQLSDSYKAYANRRGPMLASLSVLVGFPDRNPEGKRVDRGVLVEAPYLKPKAETLRKEILTLDNQFQANFTAQMAAMTRDQNDAYNALLAEIAQEIGDINRRAETAARQETLRSNTEIGPLIADSSPGKLAAVPRHSIEMNGDEIQPSKPPINSPPSNPITIKEIEPYLKIWEGVNGYSISTSDSTGTSSGRASIPDFTQQFIIWIKQSYPETFRSP